MKVWQVHTPFFFDEMSSSQRKDLNLHPYQEVGEIIRESEVVRNLIYINNVYVIVEGKTFRNFCTLIGTETESSVGTPATTIDDLPDATATSRGVVGIEEQTFGGVKHFSDFPETPSSSPSTDYQVANKKYVDTLTTAASYGIQGAVDTYAELPDPTDLKPRTIYIVRQNTVGYENGLYWVVEESGSNVWAFLDKLDLQDAAEVPYDPTIAGLLTATDTQGAIDEVAEKILNFSEAWSKETIIKVDPINGNDATADGSIFLPYATISAAANSLSVPTADQAGVYLWGQNKIIFELAPGEYLEGGADWANANDVILNIRRARIELRGSGARIAGNIRWNALFADLPCGESFNHLLSPYKDWVPEPWKTYLGARIKPTLDMTGMGSGGMEGGAVAENILVFKKVILTFESPTTAGDWQARTNTFYFTFDHIWIVGGVTVEGAYRASTTIEVNDSAVQTGAVMGAIGQHIYANRQNTTVEQLAVKASNSQLGCVFGPYAYIAELDNCRISGGFDRTVNSATTGNLTFDSSTSYSGIRDCALPATTFKLGNGTSSVSIKADELTGRQFLTKTLECGTGTATVDIMDLAKGITTARPPFANTPVGFRYFDTTLDKPVWRGNSNWVDSTGTIA